MKSYKKGMMVRLHILLEGNGVGVQFFVYFRTWEEFTNEKE